MVLLLIENYTILPAFPDRIFVQKLTTMTAAALPRTLEERLETADTIRVNASFEEYLLFAEQCEYRVEYSNHQIIAQDTPTDKHEQIVANTVWTLKNLLLDQPDFRVYGSNLGLLIQPTGAHYKPDAVVICKEPEFVFHKVKKRTFRSVVNPYAVVEIFSDGTFIYDQTEKLLNYKQCPSLEYIVYIHQHTPIVTVHTRSPYPNKWLTEDLTNLENSFELAGKQVPLDKLYHQIVFSDKPPHSAK